MDEMILRLYPDATDVDWRDMPLVLSTRFKYQNYNGSKTYEQSEWRLRKAFVTDYRIDAIPNPTDVMRETITLIAAGRTRTFKDGSSIKVPDSIIGATYFSVPTTTTSSTTRTNTVAPNPANPSNPMFPI